MTPTRRKLLIGASAALVAVLLALLILPALLEGPVERRLRAEVEQRSGFRVDWSDLDLGLFQDFPHLTLSLRELSAVGTGLFDGDTLAAIGGLDVAVNLASVLGAVRGGGPVVVRDVRLDEPRVRLRVLEDGSANWLRQATSEEPEGAAGDGGGFGVELRSFEITDGSLALDDARSGLFVSLEGLRHSLSGNFSQERLVARTNAHADRTTLTFAGTPYLPGVSLDLDAELEVVPAEARVRLMDNELRLNELALAFSGEVVPAVEGITLDLSFAAPRTEFGQILSLVPAMYAADFASLETSGTFALEGFARGVYSEGSLPSFALRVTVADGSFRYPDLPLAARAIAADLSIEGPGGDVDSTVVRLERFHVEIDGQPIDAALTLRTPVSDPDVEARLTGSVDLADLARTVRLEGFEELTGTVSADAAVRARRSDLDSARYERVAAEGLLEARGVALRGAALRQPVTVEEASLRLSPQAADLRALRAQLGSSDVQATGRLDNVLGFALWEQPLRGTASFTSRQVLLDEWRSGGEVDAIPVPPRLDLTLDGVVQRLRFGTLEMTNARGRALVADQRLTLEGFSLQTLGGSIGLDGYYETLDPAEPAFAFDVAMDDLDVAGAAEAFSTVRMLAPVARYAQGRFSADMSMSGAFDSDMAPVFERLDGSGAISTSQLSVEGFPMLQRLSEAVSVPQVARPTVNAVRSSVRIQGGRLYVQPFQAAVGGLGMTVSGSNGIDQSMDYTLGLTLPRTGLGDAAARTVQDLVSRAGVSSGVADSVRVDVQVGGTVTAPTVGLALGETVGAARGAVAGAAGAAVQQRLDDAQQRADATAEEARARARAQADSIVAEAEQRAEAIRAEARRAAETIRAEGNRAAEEVLARATNPVARAAAQPAADRLRREANDRAAALEREADERADALVAAARERADVLVGGN